VSRSFGTLLFHPSLRLLLTQFHGISYGNDEPEDTFYEPEEDVDDELPPDVDVDQDALEERAREQGDEGDEKTVVTSGDPNQTVQKPSSDADKKIPDDKRTTTPYMTKYERARVLGTRALQLR
jgi:DNA-directed RNA polymerases I, II, and III subunit RPABC2